ncbi:DNA replication complex GINS protein SLD5 [Hetaerina americana]|uniref:DNA replication complex GINS protein SLD5 n=1 Tax=Hetaerina americana TaxID=62018 RepID=UPI003A7F4FF3
MEVDINLEDSDSEETITAQSVLEKLEEAWLNEKFSPEILPHRSELVDCMLEQINQMEENVNKLKKNDFRVVVHRMELDRIRYIVTSYLRNRLDKIELFTSHILELESKRPLEERYLSPAEYKFAQEHQSHLESHFETLVLRHMPYNFQSLDKNTMCVTPNLLSQVFLRVNKSSNGVVVDAGGDAVDEEVDLDENTQHIMQYKAIADLVKSGNVQLI